MRCIDSDYIFINIIVTAGLWFVFNLRMVKILHSSGNHSYHGWSHHDHTHDDLVISY